MARCKAITKATGKQCKHNAQRRYCTQHRDVKSRGLPLADRQKDEPSRKMSATEKVKRWGKVVAHYESRTSGKTYAVRQKNRTTFSCNCPGWTNKREGEPRSCRHVIQAQEKVARQRVASRTKSRATAARPKRAKAASR